MRNRDALVVAARRLFARDGFEATTVAYIAEAADLGFGTFYRYFPDKEAVLEAVLEDGRNQIDAVLLAPEPEGTSPSLALTRLSERFLHAVRGNRDVLMLLWQVAIRRTVGRRPLSVECLAPEQSLPVVLATAIRRIIEQGIAVGEFPPGDADVLARLITGAHMYLLTPFARGADEALVITTLCEFELRALGAPQLASMLPDPVEQPVRRRTLGGH